MSWCPCVVVSLCRCVVTALDQLDQLVSSWMSKVRACLRLSVCMYKVLIEDRLFTIDELVARLVCWKVKCRILISNVQIGYWVVSRFLLPAGSSGSWLLTQARWMNGYVVLSHWLRIVKVYGTTRGDNRL